MMASWCHYIIVYSEHVVSIHVHYIIVYDGTWCQYHHGEHYIIIYDGQ